MLVIINYQRENLFFRMRYQLKRYAGVLRVLIIGCFIHGCTPVPEQPGSRPAPSWESGQQMMTAEGAYQRGLQYLAIGDFQEAIRYFQLALERDPFHLRAYLSLGDVYSMQDDYLTAEAYYSKVLQYDPRSIPALMALGNIQLRMGNHREAITLYRNVLEIDPFNRLAQQQIQEITQDLFQLYYAQGMAYKTAGEPHLAAVELQKALALVPENIELIVEIGYLFLQQQDYLMASNYFQQALSLQPDYLPALIGAGKVQLALEHYTEALDYFKEGQDLAPSDQEVGDLMRQAQAENRRRTLSSEYWAIATAEHVTRGDMAALLMVDLDLEHRLQASERLAIISDITTHWAKPYIIKAVQLGVMQVFPDRSFLPYEPIRKGELAFIVDTLFEKLFIPLRDTSAVPFQDVHQENIYYRSVMRVYAAGLLPANSADVFGFNAPLSGADMVQIIDRVKRMLP